MKRDVTRTGVRTHRGLVDDLMSYVTRFYANNVRDRRRQSAIDLLIGTTLTNAETDTALAEDSAIAINTTSTATASRVHSGQKGENKVEGSRARSKASDGPSCKKPLFSSCLLYTSPSPRDRTRSRMPSSA